MATKMVIARMGKIRDMVDAELHRSELGVNMWDVNKNIARINCQVTKIVMNSGSQFS